MKNAPAHTMAERLTDLVTFEAFYQQRYMLDREAVTEFHQNTLANYRNLNYFRLRSEYNQRKRDWMTSFRDINDFFASINVPRDGQLTFKFLGFTQHPKDQVPDYKLTKGQIRALFS